MLFFCLKRPKILGMIVFFFFIIGSGIVYSDDLPDSVKNLDPIEVIRDGEERIITIQDVYDFHGGTCPGATMAYRAAQYGFDLLYPDGDTPAADDLIILVRAPGGPLDLMDFMMKGGSDLDRTWPPAGITRSADNFVFEFYRKSTLQGVKLKLQDGLWPDDWFVLRDRHRDGSITDAEQEKRQQDRNYVIREFPKKSYAELFGEPEPFFFIAWGHIEEGEMDRHIREQRRAQRDRD